MSPEYKAKLNKAASKLTKSQVALLKTISPLDCPKLELMRYSDGSNGWNIGMRSVNSNTVDALIKRGILSLERTPYGLIHGAKLSEFGRDVYSTYLVG